MQKFIDRQFYNLTLFTLIFGVIFYDIICNLGFTFVDEICAALLLALFAYKVAHTRNWEFDKRFMIVLAVFFFYLIYSFIIGSNLKGAILTDFVIQIKPYLAFFCVYAMQPKFSDNQKFILRQTIALCSLYVFVIGVGGLMSNDIIEMTFIHPSRLATASTVLATLYLYCSDYTKKDKLIFVLILAIGILSGRSKHFGFFTICTLMALYLNKSFKMKFNLKNMAFFIIAICFMILAAYKKIDFYFIQGGFGTTRAEQDLFARAALYIFSIQIFIDYMPFGSGFASYATYASGASYSPIYEKYGMSGMHGLTKEKPDFIADTYYPALAQFGIIGVILFFWFWIYLAQKAVHAFRLGFGKEATIALMIIIFFIIECTSDATITHNRGMFIMMILGLVFSDIKTSKNVDENSVGK